MEDENGLELSLGLSCGGSSVKPKSNNGSSLDARAEELGRGGNVDDDFKNFLNAGNQRTYPSKPEENFFNDLSKAEEDYASVNSNGRELWFADNDNKHGEIEEDKPLETRNKRKMFFDEINHQKKHEIEVHHADLRDRVRKPHISITEDASNAENGDVADSKAENSTSRPFSLDDDGSKLFMRLGGSSNAPKEVFKVSDSSATDLNGQKRFIASSEKDFKLVNLTYGASFPLQQVNLRNVPYPSPVKESNSVGAPSPQIPGMIHAMPSPTSECSQPANNGNVPVMFQLPMLDKDNLQGLVFHPQQLHTSFAGTGPPNSVAKHVISNNFSEVMPLEGRPLERTKGDGKQHVPKSPSQVEDVKGTSANLREKDVSDQSAEGFPIDFSAIKPGLAADVKFGGSGSLPNLPWVSTTGSGSNGRTISGVTYRYSNNQIRIVCACHGFHMSPEDFVRHANEDTANPEVGGAVLGTVANGNPSASTHSHS